MLVDVKYHQSLNIINILKRLSEFKIVMGAIKSKSVMITDNNYLLVNLFVQIYKN